MKKLVTLMLSMIFVLSIAVMPVAAEDTLNPTAEAFRGALEAFSREALFDCVGNVKIGGDFNAQAAAIYTATMETWIGSGESDFVDPWEQYETGEETYTYVLPEKVMYDAVEKYFALTETMKQKMKEMPGWNENDKTFTIQPSTGGGMTISVYRGYSYTGNGNEYDVYSVLSKWEECTPDNTMKEWTDYWSYENSQYFRVYKIIKSRVVYNGGDCKSVKYLSYEEIDAMPEDIVTDGSKVLVIQNPNVFIKVPEGVFPEGTLIDVEELKEQQLAYVQNALKDAAGRFIAFDINALLNGEKVQPTGKVKVEFAIPDGYNIKELALFYVGENGNYQRIKLDVNEQTKTATAELEHFSIYAMAELKATSTTKAPQTGDAFGSVYMLSAVMLVAFAVAGVAYKKMRK